MVGFESVSDARGAIVNIPSSPSSSSLSYGSSYSSPSFQPSTSFPTSVLELIDDLDPERAITAEILTLAFRSLLVVVERSAMGIPTEVIVEELRLEGGGC